jgi:hypothetical protein
MRMAPTRRVMASSFGEDADDVGAPLDLAKAAVPVVDLLAPPAHLA